MDILNSRDINTTQTTRTLDFFCNNKSLILTQFWRKSLIIKKKNFLQTFISSNGNSGLFFVSVIQPGSSNLVSGRISSHKQVQHQGQISAPISNGKLSCFFKLLFFFECRIRKDGFVASGPESLWLILVQFYLLVLFTI